MRREKQYQYGKLSQIPSQMNDPNALYKIDMEMISSMADFPNWVTTSES